MPTSVALRERTRKRATERRRKKVDDTLGVFVLPRRVEVRVLVNFIHFSTVRCTGVFAQNKARKTLDAELASDVFLLLHVYQSVASYVVPLGPSLCPTALKRPKWTGPFSLDNHTNSTRIAYQLVEVRQGGIAILWLSGDSNGPEGVHEVEVFKDTDTARVGKRAYVITHGKGTLLLQFPTCEGESRGRPPARPLSGRRLESWLLLALKIPKRWNAASTFYERHLNVWVFHTLRNNSATLLGRMSDRTSR